MNAQRFGSRSIFSLLFCVFLLIGLPGEVLAKQEITEPTEKQPGELFAIDVVLSSRQVLDDLGITYQNQPRLGYWRAAATIQQLYALQEHGVSFTYAGQVAIIQGGEDAQINETSRGVETCTGSNTGNYPIPLNTGWVYSPIWTSCAGSYTVDYIDIYYDVIHPKADNALWLNVGSNSPSWSYQNIEVFDNCTTPPFPNWHKYQYNITKFRGRPVNQRWDLVASDGCSNNVGYIDYWTIWVYYNTTTPPTILPIDNSYIGPDIVISERASGEHSPSVAYNSNHDEYLVVWENDWGGGYHDIYAQRVTSNGKLLSWFSVTVDNTHNKGNPSVAYDKVNDRYLVVFAYDFWGDGSDWDIYGRYIPWYGPESFMVEFPICTWTSQQLHPVVAYGFSALSHLVVWSNDPEGGAIYLSGRILFADNSGMGDIFTVAAGGVDRDFPDVTYNLARNEFLVVYDVNNIYQGTSYDIYGIRLRGDGVPIGSGEFTIAGWTAFEAYASVAACDQANQYIVAWQSDQDSGETEWAIYTRYLNGDAVPGNIYLMDDFSDMQIQVDVSCNYIGNKYQLAWEYQYVNNEYGVWGRIAYPNEEMSNKFEISPPGWIDGRHQPAIGGGRSTYLVAWEQERFPDGNLDIHGKLLRYASFLPITIR